jgi:hypothetical protein
VLPAAAGVLLAGRHSRILHCTNHGARVTGSAKDAATLCRRWGLSAGIFAAVFLEMPVAPCSMQEQHLVCIGAIGIVMQCGSAKKVRSSGIP